MKKIKNIKISEDVHDVLKKYCEENGYKIHKFLEKIILKTCQKEKDIYGEWLYNVSDRLYCCRIWHVIFGYNKF